jgi:hypothetical protein
MNTIKEKVKSAIEIKELAMDFGQHYFAEYVYLSKLHSITNKEQVKSYVDKEHVYIDNMDIINECIYLSIIFVTSGNSSIMENETLRLKVSFETLDKYTKTPDNVIRELVAKDLELTQPQSKPYLSKSYLKLKKHLTETTTKAEFPYLKKK